MSKPIAILLGALSSLAVFGIWYLLGAFYSVSFDLSLWADGTRFMVSFMGGTTSALVFIFASGGGKF